MGVGLENFPHNYVGKSFYWMRPSFLTISVEKINNEIDMSPKKNISGMFGFREI